MLLGGIMVYIERQCEMGCSHYILNRYAPVKIKVTCYICGKEVDLNDPDTGHDNCYGVTCAWESDDEDSPLPVDIEISNTRER